MLYRSEIEISKEHRKQLTEAAAEINFDDEVRRLVSIRVNLGIDGIRKTNDTMKDFDIIYRSSHVGKTQFLRLALPLPFFDRTI